MTRTNRSSLRLAFFAAITTCAICLSSLANAAQNKAFFWEASSPQNKVFLLGSIHFARADFYPMRDAIETAFAEADHLAVEIDINAINPMELQNMILRLGTYQPPETIANHLEPTTLQQLQSYLTTNGVPFEALASQKPGLLAITLVTLELAKQGLSADHGVDLYFLRKATGSKDIIELETIEEQMTILLNPEDPQLMLEQTLAELSNYSSLIDDLLAAWHQGDSAALEELLITKPLRDYPESQADFDRIFTARNINMTRKIETFLKSGRSHFVVVGAGHLVGEQGIVELLRKAGYQLTPR